MNELQNIFLYATDEAGGGVAEPNNGGGAAVT